MVTVGHTNHGGWARGPTWGVVLGNLFRSVIPFTNVVSQLLQWSRWCSRVMTDERENEAQKLPARISLSLRNLFFFLLSAVPVTANTLFTHWNRRNTLLYELIIWCKWQQLSFASFLSQTSENKRRRVIEQQPDCASFCPLCLFVTLPPSRSPVRHTGALTPTDRVESHYFQLHHWEVRYITV